MALVGQTLTLRGEWPHPWQLSYWLPSERQQCQKDITALGVATLAATTTTMARALKALIPGTPIEMLTDTKRTTTPLSAPASRIDTREGLLIVLGEPKSLEHPAFVEWVSQLARQPSALYLLHTSALRAHHPLACSGQLYAFALPRLQSPQRIELLMHHLPLNGLLLLDSAPATLADARWLNAMRALPLWSAPGISSPADDLPLTELHNYPAPSSHANAQGALA
jgi:hypothetical protein